MQKAWRKKQLCYKIKNKDLCSKAVTDIIICSRIVHKASKMAPNGFAAAGYVIFNFVNYTRMIMLIIENILNIIFF